MAILKIIIMQKVFFRAILTSQISGFISMKFIKNDLRHNFFSSGLFYLAEPGSSDWRGSKLSVEEGGRRSKNITIDKVHRTPLDNLSWPDITRPYFFLQKSRFKTFTVWDHPRSWHLSDLSWAVKFDGEIIKDDLSNMTRQRRCYIFGFDKPSWILLQEFLGDFRRLRRTAIKKGDLQQSNWWKTSATDLSVC